MGVTIILVGFIVLGVAVWVRRELKKQEDRRQLLRRLMDI